MAFKHKRGHISVFIALLLFCFLILSLAVFAHGGEEDAIPDDEQNTAFEESINLEESLQAFNLRLLSIAAAIVALLVIIAIHYEKKIKKFKKKIFLGIIIPIILATLFLAGSTLYLNITSLTRGPAHWHADYQVWHCGQQLELTSPSGLSNRVGSSTLHSHDDNRIHIEGVVRNFDQVSLRAYFKSVGGELSDDS